MSCQYDTVTNFNCVFQANELQDIEGATTKKTETLLAGETYVL